MHVLVLASQKGGSGKTTLSGHLAVEAQAAGVGPVALIDTDPQGSLSHWWNAQDLVAGGKPLNLILDDPRAGAFIADRAERLQYLDTLTYLPDDILTKLDRASMAVSLEARVPLLDHRVVAFSWRLPSAWKARPGAGKYLLRRVLDRFCPEREPGAR